MAYENLLIWQYKTKPKALGTIKLLTKIFESSWHGIQTLPKALDIETATGKNLDLIGKHVGQNRILTDFNARPLFGFYGAENGLGFRRNRVSAGGVFYRYKDSLKQSIRLNDTDYRFLIKCRIAKNYQTATIGDVSRMLAFIFSNNSIAYDNFDMTLSVFIEDQSLSTFKRYVIKNLDILPRPVGVGIKYYLAVPDKPFGFKGAPDAGGFNEGIFMRFI
ncbi:DUF2612 domain-containing protein [Thorsellia anophelis]|uniref:DUF2612 domain-containing protein n=1 Tax=Thorsellia anophelis DSM 18579 TaxID=1123402 RepID=A0A1I0CD33_9GAMM|nr:DUF2612 domain-containing protein [Thorsellia anophelis]SET17492.1 Protein of unknown function [Thorsellia anophelis DSM 18579]